MTEPQQTREIEIDIESGTGALADVADRLAQEDIDILGFMANARTGEGLANFVTSDPERAIAALEKAGYHPRATESLIVPAANRPGELAEVARRLEKEDIGIERSFVAVGSRGENLGIGLTVDDPSRARKLLQG